MAFRSMSSNALVVSHSKTRTATVVRSSSSSGDSTAEPDLPEPDVTNTRSPNRTGSSSVRTPTTGVERGTTGPSNGLSARRIST